MADTEHVIQPAVNKCPMTDWATRRWSRQITCSDSAGFRGLLLPCVPTGGEAEAPFVAGRRILLTSAQMQGDGPH